MTSDPPAPRSNVAFAVLLVVAWVGLTGMFIGTGVVLSHSATIAHLDHHITSSVVARRTPALDSTMKVVTWLGSWVAVAVTGGVLLALVAIRRLAPIVLILATVGWAGEFAAVTIAKHAVGRQRPPESLWLVNVHGGSFPSGHAANATLVFMSLAFASLQLFRLRAGRVAGCVVAFLGIVTVGFSRVELGVHWTTDVMASFVLVAGWLTVIACLFVPRVPPITTDSSLTDDAIERAERSPRDAELLRSAAPFRADGGGREIDLGVASASRDRPGGRSQVAVLVHREGRRRLWTRPDLMRGRDGHLIRPV